MKYFFALLIFTFLLTGCGDTANEVMEGMTSEDAAVGREILTEAMKQPVEEPQPDLTPIPAGFNLAEICSYLDADARASLTPCLANAREIPAEPSQGNGKYAAYIGYGSCSFMCTNDQGVPLGGMVQFTVIHNGRDGGALQAYEAEQYQPKESLAGADGVYYPKNGDIVIGVRNNYRVKINGMIGNSIKPEEIGKAKFNGVLSSIFAKLPQ